MEYNKKNWKLIQELSLRQINKFNENRLIKNENVSSLKLYKKSATKSYKYVGENSEDDLSIIKFKTEVYRDVAQNQISIF